MAENVDRAQELQIQSLLDQAKAQDEVDKRLEENVTAFRKAEAQLKNYRAEMGNELLPALTHVTEAQGRLTSALNDFVGTNVGGATAQFVIMAQQFGKLAAGPFDMFINLMQLKVALMTQKAITKSMLGTELVRKQVYGRTNEITGALTGRLNQQQMLQSQIFILEKMRSALTQNITFSNAVAVDSLQEQVLANERLTNEVKERLAVQDMLIQGEQEGKTSAQMRLSMVMAERDTMRALTTEQQVAFRVNFANSMVLHRKNITDASDLRRQFDMMSMEKQQDFIEEFNSAGNLHAKKKAHLQAEIALMMKEGDMAKDLDGKRMRRNLSQEAAIKKREADINRLSGLEIASQVKVEEKYGQVGFRRLAGLEKLISKEQEYILTQDTYIQRELQRQQIEAARANDEAEMHRLKSVSVTLEKELQAALSNTEGQKQTLLLVEEALTNAMRELNFHIHDQGVEALHAAGGLGFLAGRMPAVAAGAETTAPKLDRLTMSANKFSMVLGMASMATMMFGDSKHAARASIILMTASMIPMVVQIGAVTTGLQGQDVAQNVANASMFTGAAAAKAFSAALISTGFGALAVLAGLAISFGLEAAGVFDDAGDSVESYGNIVGTVTQETIDFAKANEDMPMSQITTNIRDLQQEYGRLTEAIEGADGATASLLNTQLNAVNESLGNFQTLQSKTIADLFTEGQLDEGDIRAYFQIDDFQKEIDDFEKGVTDAGFFGIDLMPDFIAAHPLEDPLSELSGDLLLMEQSFKSGGQAQKDFFNFMRTQGFKDADDVLTFLRTMGAVFDDGVVDPIKSATEHLTTFSEQLFDFNNQREELFFGFSSANLTGDLMKQVINEGV